MRILIIEDEHKIANAIKRGLELQAYAVDIAHNGDDGFAMASTEPYDLIILDRMLPGSIDGLGITRKLRAAQNHTPVLMLTAKDRVIDRAAGLNSGADDYLVKPFAFVELVARVRALLRRSPTTHDTILRYDTVSLDTQTMQVMRGDVALDVTAKEFSLLEYLLRHAEQVVSKDTLIQHVWNYDADILPNTVEVYIGYLRNKLDKPFKDAPLLHTKRGFGYILARRSPH